MKTTVAAMLSLRREAQAIEWYEAAFGAKIFFRIGDEGGTVVPELAVGESVFWVADQSPEHRNFSPELLGGSSVRMILDVDDPDAASQKALAAGAKAVWPVKDQPYGWRIGRVVEPFGQHRRIGKPLNA